MDHRLVLLANKAPSGAAVRDMATVDLPMRTAVRVVNPISERAMVMPSLHPLLPSRRPKSQRMLRVVERKVIRA